MSPNTLTAMAAGENWSDTEIETIVPIYFEMLRLELIGRSYNKTEYRRGLIPLLQGRSEGSIEFKHQNISAVLIQMRLPYIEGYKPRFNSQGCLTEAVAECVARDHKLLELLNQDLQPAYNASQSLLLEPPPDALPFTPERPVLFKGQLIDFARRESENRKLGTAGESLVVDYEKQRLLSSGRDDLEKKVEWVSRTQGDGLGFDILSFDEQDDSERLIEVKTTTQGKYFPFYATRNEVQCSEQRAEQYYVYRVFAFNRRPKIYTLQGALSESCNLDPVVYRAIPGRTD